MSRTIYYPIVLAICVLAQLALAAEPQQRLGGADATQSADDLEKEATRALQSGDYSSALSLAEKELKIREAIASTADIALAKTLIMIAALDGSLDKPADAETFCARALNLLETHRGKEDAAVGICLSLLGSIRAQQPSKYTNSQTEEVFRRADGMLRKTLGRESLPYAQNLSRLGALLSREAKYDAANDALREALATEERILGPSDPEVATTLDRLASLESDRGMYEDALKSFDRAAAIQEKAYGRNSPALAATINNQGTLFVRQGNTTRAEANYRRALAIRENALGADSMATAETVDNLANVVHDLGRVDEATHLHKRAESIRAEHAKRVQHRDN